MMYRFMLIIFLVVSFQNLSYGQTIDQLGERIKKLEENFSTLTSALSQDPSSQKNPQKINRQNTALKILFLQFDQLENQVRALTNALEELTHKFEKNQSQLLVPISEKKPQSMPVNEQKNVVDLVQKIHLSDQNHVEKKNDPFLKASSSQKKTSSPIISSSAKKDYDHAFSFLSKRQFKEAQMAFGTFVVRYPKHKLLENAYYWLAETYYVLENYPKAVDSFRYNVQKYPQGMKMTDNLLKLGMSLKHIHKKQEACLTLNHLLYNYPNALVSIRERAKNERDKYGCAS